MQSNKNKESNNSEFIFEMDNLGKAQKLFNMRLKYAVSDPEIPPEERLNFAAGDKTDGLKFAITNLMKAKK